MNIDWKNIEQQIRAHIEPKFTLKNQQPISGGCINQCWHIHSQQHDFFIKLNDKSQLNMFKAEAFSLQQLHSTNTLFTPLPLLTGKTEQHSFLIMEHYQLSNHGTQAELGTQLALLHQHQHQQFGFENNNFIGTNIQYNNWHTDWATFWQTERLLPQLELGRNSGFSKSLLGKGIQLLDHIPSLLNHNPKASLLHGDLWSGNTAFLNNHKPCIFDPASYYGDHECDLAMTELFGGFSQAFYHAYQQISPLDYGYHTRKHIYNLYHILNHANLFGGGYLRQAESTIIDLLRE